MKVLLSIKPKYVKEIFEGNKKYEYRKRIYKNESIDTIVVYSSSPTKKIVGEIKIKDILVDSPLKIWESTKKHSGIDKSDYFKYFAGKSQAYALVIDDTILYNKPLDLLEYDSKLKYPPQSFIYI